MLRQLVVEGENAATLESKAHSYIDALKAGGLPVGFSFVGQYVNNQRYPYALCVCVNDEVVHGVPSPDKVFKKGDLVSVDAGVTYKGYHTDSAFSIIVGEEDTELVNATRKALHAGIAKAAPGNKLSDISYAIQKSVELDGFFVVRQFAGHGIGTELHELPKVLNYGRPGMGVTLVPGMVLAIEPIVAERRCDLFIENGLVYKAKDNVMSAHFEETVIITTDKPLIVTRMS